MENENGWTRVHYRRGRMVPPRQTTTDFDTTTEFDATSFGPPRTGRGYPRTWGPGFQRFPSRPTTIYEPRYDDDIHYQPVERSAARGRDNYRVSYAEMVRRPPRSRGNRNYPNERRYRTRVFYGQQQQQQPRTRPNQNFYRTRVNQTRSGQNYYQTRPNQNPYRTRPTGQPNNEYIPPSPQLKKEIQMIFKLIRLTHHLENVTPTEGGELPITFARLENYLANVIRPAFPNEKTKDNLIGNSKNWIYTTQLILEDHYETTIRHTLEEFISNLQGDWRLAFEIAERWAYRYFGQRLQPDTLASVEALIVGTIPKTTTTGDRETQDEPRTSTRPSEVECQPSSILETESMERTLTTLTLQDPTVDLPQAQPEPRPQRGRRSRPCVADVIMEIVPDPVEENLPVIPEPVDLPVTTTRRPTDSTPPSRTRQTLLISTLNQKNMNRQCTVPLPEISPIRDIRDPNLIELDKEDDLLSSPVRMDGSPSLTPVQLKSPQTGDETLQIRPTRHMTTPRKLVDWHLLVRKKWIIIGDSNLASFPSYQIPDLQIDSFPGANFVHAEALLKKAVVHSNVEKLVLAFGINHRSQKMKQTAIKQLQRAVHAAKIRFPYAEIWVPEINFYRGLPLTEQSQLEKLNTYIKKNMGHIPALPTGKFGVRGDGIHWTPETARAMLWHWCAHLNF